MHLTNAESISYKVRDVTNRNRSAPQSAACVAALLHQHHARIGAVHTEPVTQHSCYTAQQQCTRTSSVTDCVCD